MSFASMWPRTSINGYIVSLRTPSFLISHKQLQKWKPSSLERIPVRKCIAAQISSRLQEADKRVSEWARKSEQSAKKLLSEETELLLMFWTTRVKERGLPSAYSLPEQVECAHAQRLGPGRWEKNRQVTSMRAYKKNNRLLSKEYKDKKNRQVSRNSYCQVLVIFLSSTKEVAWAKHSSQQAQPPSEKWRHCVKFGSLWSNNIFFPFQLERSRKLQHNNRCLWSWEWPAEYGASCALILVVPFII